MKRASLLAVCALLSTTSAGAQYLIEGQAIENILVSKQDSQAIVRVLPTCRMRYLVHSPPKGGTSVRIRVTLGRDCADAFEETLSERFEPAGRNTADLIDVAFDATSRWNGSITLNFSRPRTFTVAPGENGWIEIRLDASRDAVEFADARPDPLPAPDPTPPTPAERIEAKRRLGPAANPGPSRSQSWEAPGDTYAVQIGIFEDPRNALAALTADFAALPVATQPLTVSGRDWTEILAGPYAKLADAENAWRTLNTRFPDSWIRVVPTFAATPVDRSLASDGAVAAALGDLALDDAELTERMSIARTALLAQNYALAISNYRDVLAVAGHGYRADAREYLGVAYERDLQTTQAMAEYRAWLAEFGDSPDAVRVAARLNGLDNASAEPRDGAFAIAATAGPAPTMSWRGGISQVFRRDVSQFVDDGDGRLTASALYNYADLAFVRRGERFDALGRFSGSYIFDANDEARLSRDTGWISDAFVRLTDNQLGIDATIGRQRANGTGVLSRFDGLKLDYTLRDGITIGGVAGIPVDTARYAPNGDRQLYGGNVLFTDILAGIDAQIYGIRQTVDGIVDRDAVGAEVYFANGPISATALLDFDVSFNELNLFLVSGNWQATDRLELNALVETGRNPALTTRNALSGQTVRTVGSLRSVYSEGQIRTLALDRTPEASNLGVGAAYTLSDRTRLSVDYAARETDATVASGGVAALPATGRQTYLIATLTTTSLVRDGGLTRVQLRQDSTRTQDVTRLTLETRIPFRGLRINPLLHVSTRDILTDGSEQTVIEPVLRVFYRWRETMLFEIEAGGRYSNRELAPGVVDPFVADGEEELLGSYINIGYRWEF